MDHTPAYLGLDIMSRLWSPYQLNPFGFNPLRDIVEHVIELDRVRACEAIKPLRLGDQRAQRQDPRLQEPGRSRSTP